MSLTIQNLELRKNILVILESSYPDPVGSKTMEIIVKDAGYDFDCKRIDKEIAYLSEKGYVTTETLGNKEVGLQRTLVKLTSDGIDFLEKEKR